MDLEYPDELHDFHNDYLLASESVKGNGVKKLIPNLMDKEKMVLHVKNLKLFLSLGMKLKKIWRGVKFREEAFMKPYIELNTKLRTKAKNNFEKNFFKLMSNSVFGKPMENVRNRVDVRLINSREQKKKLVSKPNFQHATHFGKKLAAIHMKKGESSVEQANLLWCSNFGSLQMHHVSFSLWFREKKWNNLKVLHTATDSLIYEIETEDFFADIAEDVEKWFDTSDYEKDHPAVLNGFPVGKNKKVLGMFKDECKGKNHERIHCIEIQMLFRFGEKMIREQNLIRSRGHDVFTETMQMMTSELFWRMAFPHWQLGIGD